MKEEPNLFLVRHNLGFGELVEPATTFELEGVAHNKLFDCALLWNVQDPESVKYVLNLYLIVQLCVKPVRFNFTETIRSLSFSCESSSPAEESQLLN